MEAHLGEFLRRLREERGLSTADISKETGIHRSYLWLLENGRRQRPRPEVLKKLAVGYGVSVETLLSRAGYMPSSAEEQKMKEKEEKVNVERAFRHVLTDPNFHYGTRLSGELPLNVKRFVIEMYEKATKRKILTEESKKPL